MRGHRQIGGGLGGDTMNQIDGYVKNMVMVTNAPWDEPTKLNICLPHSCEYWIIGTDKEAELLIEDLRSENDAAARKIKKLSRMLYNMGIDPTQ